MLEAKEKNKTYLNKYIRISFWGIIVSAILVIFYLIKTIFAKPFGHLDPSIFNIVGLVISQFYLFYCVYGIFVIIQKKSGNYWIVFLFGLIFGIFTPLGWFSIVGVVFSFLSGAAFSVFILLSKKEKTIKNKDNEQKENDDQNEYEDDDQNEYEDIKENDDQNVFQEI